MPKNHRCRQSIWSQVILVCTYIGYFKKFCELFSSVLKYYVDSWGYYFFFSYILEMVIN